VRRDVLRVGIGRLLFEIALGALLALPTDESLRVTAMVTALACAFAAHFALRTGLRRAFVAAHVAMLAAALAAHLPTRFAVPLAAAGLGGAIELAHVDLVQRRRLTEHVRSMRIPSSLLVRRLGSAVIVGIAGRASLGAAAYLARPQGLAPLLMALGAFAMLAAGMRAGPGRPVVRPFDALAFVLLGALLVVPL
jgi:hypothetical protein